MQTLPSFYEIRFPEDIACGSSGGPEYLTDIITTASGHEQRNINWSFAKRRFNVAHGIKTLEQFAELTSFFHNCRGCAIGFRFKDWSDYQGTQEELIQLNQDNKQEFQLCKHYSLHTQNNTNLNTTRIITKPVLDTVKLFVLDKDNQILTLQSQNYHAKINYTTGNIELAETLKENHKLIADFEFDIAARFDTDYLPSVFEGSDLYSLNKIPIVEIKLK